MMSGVQPTITVEHFYQQQKSSNLGPQDTSKAKRRNSASPPTLRVSHAVCRRLSSVLCGTHMSEESESSPPTSKPRVIPQTSYHNNGIASSKNTPGDGLPRSHHKHHRGSDSRDDYGRTKNASPVHTAGSFLAPTNPNIYARRKSSPAITEGGSLPLTALLSTAADGSGVVERSTRRHHHQQHHHHHHHASRRSNQESLSPSTSPPHQLQHRRLSSPPSLERAVDKRPLCNQCGMFGSDCRCIAKSGSNQSSGSNSMQMLSISSLNTSSTDMRENTVISGHQEIQTLFAPNNVVYPDSISVNLINAPGNSTIQCDCGHINCPMCNLMMNLELTSESYK